MSLQTPDESPYHFSNVYASLIERFEILDWEEIDLPRDQQMRFQFLQRALGYAQELNEAPGAFPTMPLSDVRCNRC